ncbi:MAG TPA: hypothetical protein P5120_09345 [Spirochaetota bacterium]|nr:hypothetical protein [Spirochaetota bacterium]HPF06679.1 hypothetical protein [Spirochaetota bacterium]HPJ41736.1 hypothetical protein [Spirochaetota bacterium]HPR36647.1 hypothetical protein [Spirochaetota bacterium]HRX47712.1 hypothetical protein [Spirochaetota bacterium]
MINYFILFFGITQLIIASVEIIMPQKSFLTWKVWVSCRFFPIHGAALIVVGFPLTIYNGYLSSLIFLIGLVVVFTGPVILIYPEKIREAFSFSSETFQEGSLKKIVRFDAVMRMAAGFIMVLSFYKS